MLDFFLILGLIPGTNIVITFNEVLAAAALVAGGLYYLARFSHGGQKAQPLIIWDSLVRYELPQFVIPQQATAHNFAGPSIDAWRTWLNQHWRTVR